MVNACRIAEHGRFDHTPDGFDLLDHAPDSKGRGHRRHHLNRSANDIHRPKAISFRRLAYRQRCRSISSAFGYNDRTSLARVRARLYPTRGLGTGTARSAGILVGLRGPGRCRGFKIGHACLKIPPDTPIISPVVASSAFVFAKRSVLVFHLLWTRLDMDRAWLTAGDRRLPG